MDAKKDDCIFPHGVGLPVKDVAGIPSPHANLFNRAHRLTRHRRLGDRINFGVVDAEVRIHQFASCGKYQARDETEGEPRKDTFELNIASCMQGYA